MCKLQKLIQKNHKYQPEKNHLMVDQENDYLKRILQNISIKKLKNILGEIFS